MARFFAEWSTMAIRIPEKWLAPQELPFSAQENNTLADDYPKILVQYGSQFVNESQIKTWEHPVLFQSLEDSIRVTPFTRLTNSFLPFIINEVNSMETQATQDLQKKPSSPARIQAESEIQKILNQFHMAFKEKNLDKIMSFYSTNVVAYDFLNDLQYQGKEAYRASWSDFTENKGMNLDYETKELKIFADENLAFAHSLCHTVGEMADGKSLNLWLRWTSCFAKYENQWLITHEHVSLPIDLEKNIALSHLEPGTKAKH